MKKILFVLILLVLLAKNVNADYNLYFGDLHGHTNFSDGMGYPADYFTYCRDSAKLDFCAVTDHNAGKTALSNTTLEANNFNSPSFVAFVGMEWSSSRYGHKPCYNISNPCSSSSSTCDTPDKLYNSVKNDGGLCHAAHPATTWTGQNETDWNYSKDEVEVAGEVYANESKMNYAWKIYNLKMGVVGVGDSHNGRPGYGGITGCYATELTRKGILDALKARRCFATNANRTQYPMNISFKANGHLMGEEISLDYGSNINFDIIVNATYNINSIQLKKNGTVISTKNDCNSQNCVLSYSSTADGTSYYYAVATTTAGKTIWSSPIWFDAIKVVEEPKKVVHLNSTDYDHLFDPENKSFFIIGANYEGYFDRCWKMWNNAYFNTDLIDLDFQKAKNAGINALRIFVQNDLASDIINGDFAKLDAVVSIAEKYGIYLIITFQDYSASTQSILQVDNLIAKHLSEKSIILAYDLKNEPQKNDIINQTSWTQCLMNKYIDTATLNATWNSINSLYALNSSESISNVPVPSQKWDSPRWHDYVYCLNNSLDEWIKVRIQSIRSADTNHIITVGYNDPLLFSFSVNNQLDVMSYHIYINQMDYPSQLLKLQTLDVLRSLFNKPFLLEEFGLSNNITDEATSANIELMTYEYIYRKGYAGAFKWMLNDNPVPTQTLYEAYFGMYKTGDMPKPIVFVLKEFSDYASSHALPSRSDLKKINLIDNPEYRTMVINEYLNHFKTFPLFPYDISYTNGDFAVYASSSYATKESLENLSSVSSQKLTFVFRPYNSLRRFDNSTKFTFTYPSKIIMQSYNNLTLNGSLIKISIPNDIPQFDSTEKNTTIIMYDDENKIFVTKSDNFVALPFSYVSSQIPKTEWEELFKRLGIFPPNIMDIQTGLPITSNYNRNGFCSHNDYITVLSSNLSELTSENYKQDAKNFSFKIDGTGYKKIVLILPNKTVGNYFRIWADKNLVAVYDNGVVTNYSNYQLEYDPLTQIANLIVP